MSRRMVEVDDDLACFRRTVFRCSHSQTSQAECYECRGRGSSLKAEAHAPRAERLRTVPGNEPSVSEVSAGGGGRTRTPLARPRILSPVRLPVPPPRHQATAEVLHAPDNDDILIRCLPGGSNRSTRRAAACPSTTCSKR